MQEGALDIKPLVAGWEWNTQPLGYHCIFVAPYLDKLFFFFFIYFFIFLICMHNGERMFG